MMEKSQLHYKIQPSSGPSDFQEFQSFSQGNSIVCVLSEKYGSQAQIFLHNNWLNREYLVMRFK